MRYLIFGLDLSGSPKEDAMTVGTVAALTFNVAVLCGATPARMNVALQFSEPASHGVFIYDSATRAVIVSEGVPIVQERVDTHTEKIFPINHTPTLLQDLTLDLRTNALVGVSLVPTAGCMVVDPLPQAPVREVK
jgi:hypothetical protein